MLLWLKLNHVYENALRWSSCRNRNDHQRACLAIKSLYVPGTGDRFENAYELVNLGALKSALNKLHIFQCMSKRYCVGFQRILLKFHTKYLTHAWEETIVIQCGKFKNCQMCTNSYAGYSWHLLLYRRHGDGLCPVGRQRELHTGKGTSTMRTSSCWLILPERSNVTLSLTSHIYHTRYPTQYVTLHGTDRCGKYLQPDRTLEYLQTFSLCQVIG